jgi:hypothetical protein
MPEKAMMSDDFDWDVDRPERTQELFERFDVQKAKQIIVASPRPVEMIDLKKHRAALQDYLDGVKLKDNVDWTQVDTALPVIFGQTPEGKSPIDGRHRIDKALRDQLEFLPAVFLTQDETNAIRLM